jgi:Protein of unknown function (DUF3168)
MIDADLRAYLIALATGAGERVFVGNAPAGQDMPLIIIRRTGGGRRTALGGEVIFNKTSFSIDVLTVSYPTAYPIATAILEALHEFKGVMGGTTVALAKCVGFPRDDSEIDGDNVTRWVASEYQFTY